MRRRRSNAGIFQRLLEGGTRTTYHGKIRDRKGKLTAQVRQGKQSVYKGVRIIPVGNGEFETSLDSSRFESKRDARRFVDSWKQSNPKGKKGDFSRCVKAVSQRKGAKDPEAICAAQEKKYRKNARFVPRVELRKVGKHWAVIVHEKPAAGSIAPRYHTFGVYGSRDEALEASAELREHHRTQSNPADAAMAVSEEFHGRKVKAMIPVSQKRHYHKYLAELGELRKLEVLARDGKHRVTLSKFDGAMLCTNEDKNQLFLVGGDQGVDLRDFGIKDAHETETLGEVTKIEYFTDKEHLGSEGGEAVYVHKFRTTNGGRGHQTVRMARNPDLIYYLRDEHLEFSGGSYFIRAEGIDL